MYLCGTSTTDTIVFYWIGFTAYPAMNATATGSITRGTSAGVPCSPITEIYNPNVNFGNGDHDIIISSLVGAGADGLLRTDDISTGTITGTLSGLSYPGGTSGIIWDNTRPRPRLRALLQHPGHQRQYWRLQRQHPLRCQVNSTGIELRRPSRVG